MSYFEKYGKHSTEFFAPPEREVESGVWSTGRAFACSHCDKKTGFRIMVEPGNPGVPSCSEACTTILRPPSSVVEQHLDMVKVTGSSPVVGTTSEIAPVEAGHD